MAGQTEAELIRRQEIGYNNYGKSPIYKDAFSSQITTVWSDLKVNGLNDSISDMCYNRLLSCFIRDGRDAVEARQAALFSYLKASGFAYNKDTDGIRRHYASLPSDNLYIKRVLKNLCTNYINVPDREFLNPDSKDILTNESLVTELNNALKDASIDYALNKLHQRAKFAGKCLAIPRVRRGRLNIQILLPDSYQTVKDEYGEIIEVYIPFYELVNKPGTDEYTTEQRFHYWDNTFYRVLNDKGEKVPFVKSFKKYNPVTGGFTEPVTLEVDEYPHKYGVIPVVELNFDMNDGDGTEGNEDLYELLKAQIACNMLDYLAHENVIFSAISFWVFVNFGLGRENLPLSPGTALIQNNVTAGDGGENIPPMADSISQTTYFDAIEEFKKSIMINAMKNLGLPSSLVTDNPGLASGEALKVDYRELEMIRKEDVSLLRPFEKELIDKLIIVANIDEASPYKGKLNAKYDISIDYKELYSNEKTKEEIDILEQKKGMGVISPLEYLRALKADDEITTDEAAIEEINKNLELFSQIKRSGNDETGIDGNRIETGDRSPQDGSAIAQGSPDEQPIIGTGKENTGNRNDFTETN